MDDTKIDAFTAIQELVADLFEYFKPANPKTVTPLVLYNRLLKQIKMTDKDSIDKVINGFEKFFDEHEEDVINDTLEKLEIKTCIYFGESQRIFIEIQNFLNKSDEDGKKVIRQHLLTISMILAPNKEKKKKLREIAEENSPEAQLVNTFVDKFKNMETEMDPSKPPASLVDLLKDKQISSMFAEFTNQTENKKIDPKKMMKHVYQGMGKLLGDLEEE